MTADQNWDAWLASRPQVIRDLAEAYPPNIRYRLRSTNQIGVLYSYSDDGTVTMDFPQEWNPLQPDIQVFGLDPADLEPLPREHSM